MKRALSYIVLMLLLATGGSATPVIRLTAQYPYQRITPQTGWFVDSSARLTLAAIMQPGYQSRFTPVGHQIGAYGITDAAIWVHGSYTYTGQDKAYLLIEFANIDSITLYYYHQGVLNTISSGSHTPLKNKPLNIPGFCFEIPAAADGQPLDFWLRVCTGNAVIVPLAMATANGLPQSLAGMYIIELVYVGILLALFCYNLLLYWWIRDRAYLYYLGYLFFFAAFVLLYLRGFHVMLGQSLSSFINLYGMGVVAASFMFAIRFSITFLHGDQYAPRLTRVLRIIAHLLWITILCCLAGWRHATIRQQELISISVPIMFIWMAIRAYRRHYKPALYFLLAWSLLVASIVLFAIANMGFIPFDNWAFHILPVGSAIEMILLSLALGYRYALLKKEKIALQEAQLQLINEQNTLLEQKVNERTQELQKALQQLKDSNRVKDKLLSIVSHDLRSPLNNLSGFLELGEKKNFTVEQVQLFLQMLRRNIKHISKTITNLLDWSLTQTNSIETRLSRVALAPLTYQVMDTYQFSADQKDIRLEKSISEETAVLADGHQLDVILRNLVDNAIKFTPRGGVVTVGCRPGVGQAEIYVADNGTGMLQEDADKLLHKNGLYTTGGTANEKGTGLGLQLCKEFVANNGGVLQIKTVVGTGTEFYFSLPLAHE